MKKEDILEARLDVAPNNSMKGRFQLIASGESELDATMFSRSLGMSDLSASISVRVQDKRDLESTFEVKYRNESEVEASISPVVSDYLESTVELRPHGSMFGVFELIEPPRITDTIITNKDATVRSSNEYRYVNFGKNPTMMVGSNDLETLRSYVHFDLSQYPNTLKVEKAKARIYYTGELANKDFEFWKIDRVWDEYGITYANRPLEESFLTDDYVINTEEKCIEVDLLDYVNEIIVDGVDNFGLLIKAKDETDLKSSSLFTKESSLKPYIEITYFDTRVTSVGESSINGTIQIIGVDDSELESTLIVVTDYGFDHVEGTFYVHRADTPVHQWQDGVIAVTIPEVVATFRARLMGEDHLNARLTVAKIEGEELDSFIHVNNPEIISTMYLRHTDDIEATLHTRAFDTSEIISSLQVNTPERDGSIGVRAYGESDVEGYFTVAQYTHEELSGCLAVTRGAIEGTIFVRAYGESDVEGYFTVAQYTHEELSGCLAVTRGAIEGTIFVRAYGESDLDGTLIVNQKEVVDLDSIINVSQPELHAYMTVVIVDQVDAKTTISNPEIMTTLTPRVVGEDDLDGFVYPRVIEVSDLNSTLSTINRYRSGAYYYII